jgi:NAD-dependent deacetylase
VPDLLLAESLPASLPDLWAYWAPFRDRVRSAEPTHAHRVLAAWQRARTAAGDEITLVTANVDDLHERAGSERAHHLHGSVFTTTCLSPACPGRVDGDARSDPSTSPCPVCGGATRPGLVLFGEVVDLDAQWAARRMLRQCEALVAIGTSGAVTPPYSWLRYARDVGAPSIQVNPDPDAGDGFDLHVRLEADVAAPLLFET